MLLNSNDPAGHRLNMHIVAKEQRHADKRAAVTRQDEYLSLLIIP